MTEELRAYYALAPWGDYLAAKARADHARGEMRADEGTEWWLAEDFQRWQNLDEERKQLLAKLRATPEHKAAFGW